MFVPYTMYSLVYTHTHTHPYTYKAWMHMEGVPATCNSAEFLQATQYLSISGVHCLLCWASYAVVFYLVCIYYSHTLCLLLFFED